MNKSILILVTIISVFQSDLSFAENSRIPTPKDSGSVPAKKDSGGQPTDKKDTAPEPVKKEDPAPIEDEMSHFYKEMQTEIEIAEIRVKLLLEKANQTDIIYTDIIRLELEIAITMLNVKQLLVANFIGTESLNSHHVREKLLSILKKEVISEIDLLELQLLVAKEKHKH